MKREIAPEMSVHIGQLRVPKDVAIRSHIAQFWNPQNHGEITWNDSPSPIRRQHGDLASIVKDLLSAESKRKLGRILQGALKTQLTTKERQVIMLANKNRRGQL